MKHLELTNAIIAELKTVTAFGDRVFASPSRLALPQGMATPLVVVVYKGSDPTPQKGGIPTKHKYAHHFAIYVVHSIWKEELVVTDSTEGLLALQKKAVDELKDQRFSAVDLGILPALKSLLGTEDYIDYGWYGASIGFEIDYLEVET